MRQKTGFYFICKVKYKKVMEDGLAKMVSEQYVVEAMSFTEAEARITREMKAYISGDFSVEDISKAQFKEVWFTDADTDDKWYKAKLAFLSIDECSGDVKRSNVVYLVQASSLDNALKNVNAGMAKTTIDFDSIAMQETMFMDIYESE